MNFRKGSVLFALLALLATIGCETEFDKYYEVPKSAKWTIYKVLEEDKEVDYSLFLEALDELEEKETIEKVLDPEFIPTHLKENLASTGLYTVFAVDNVGMNDFMAKKGYLNVSDFSLTELTQIMNYHVLDNSYSAYFLGRAFVDLDNAGDPTYFKKRTKYRPNPDMKPSGNLVYGKDSLTFAYQRKMIAFFNVDYINEFGLTEEDITEFFPGVGDVNFSDGDVLASNSLIVERDIRAINGYIQRVNSIMEPLRNIADAFEEELATPSTGDGISDFIKLLKLTRNENEDTMVFSNYFTGLYDDEKDYYVFPWPVHSNDGIMRLGFEVPSSGTHNVGDSEAAKTELVTVIAPTNSALKEFYDTYFAAIYPNMDSLPQFVVDIIVNDGLFNNDAVYPSQLEAGSFLTDYDMPYIYTGDQIAKKEFTSNGILYTVNKFRVPDVFNSMLLPLIANPVDSNLVWMIFKAEYDRLLVSDPAVATYTLFAPSNDALASMEYAYDDLLSAIIGPSGLPIGRSECQSVLDRLIVVGELELPNSSAEEQYIRTRNGRYMGLTKDSIWLASGTFTNPLPKTYVDIAARGNEVNGYVYPIDEELTLPVNDIGSFLVSEPECSEFYQLFIDAGIFNVFAKNLPSSFAKSTGGHSVFMPSNQAVLDAKAEGILPADKDSLAGYLKSYFLGTYGD
ncbi:hypothetical protein OAA06_02430, partial [bacterium]|nr:hypothetical protein [bacterium]